MVSFYLIKCIYFKPPSSSSDIHSSILQVDLVVDLVVISMSFCQSSLLVVEPISTCYDQTPREINLNTFFPDHIGLVYSSILKKFDESGSVLPIPKLNRHTIPQDISPFSYYQTNLQLFRQIK